MNTGATAVSHHLGLKYMWFVLAIWVGPVTTLLMYPYFGWAYARFSLWLAVLGAGFGLWRKYRSYIGPVDRLVSLLFVVVFFLFPLGIGGVGVMFGSALQRQDIVPMAGLLTLLSLAISLLSGAWMAVRVVRSCPAKSGPDWLASRVDLVQERMRDQDGVIQLGSPGWGSASYNFGIAISLNVPLMFEGLGFGRYTPLIFVVPILVGLLGWIAYRCGDAFVYFARIAQLEREKGARFVTSWYSDVMAYRRTLWLAKWLCRPEDLVEPQTKNLPRKERRRVRAAGASAR